MMEKRWGAILGDDVFALEGLHRAVDRGDRRSQLMGDGRDEIRLELLQPPLLSQIAECVNSPLREAHPGDREPELTTLQLDGKRRRRPVDAAGALAMLTPCASVSQPRITSSTGRPSTASAGTPVIASAAGFQSRTTPFASTRNTPSAT